MMINGGKAGGHDGGEEGRLVPEGQQVLQMAEGRLVDGTRCQGQIKSQTGGRYGRAEGRRDQQRGPQRTDVWR